MKSGRMSYLSSKEDKSIMREKIYKKLLRLGPSYQEKLATSEIVHLKTLIWFVQIVRCVVLVLL